MSAEIVNVRPANEHEQATPLYVQWLSRTWGCTYGHHVAPCADTCPDCRFRDCTHCPGCGCCLGDPHSFDCPPGWGGGSR